MESPTNAQRMDCSFEECDDTKTNKSEKEIKFANSNIQITTLTPYKSLNDFQKFIAHEEFGRFLVIASKVKVVRNALVSGQISRTPDVMKFNHSRSNLASKQVADTIQYIQSNMLPFLSSNSSVLAIPRGTFPSTDTLIDESINSLVGEFQKCLSLHLENKTSKLSITNKNDNHQLLTRKKPRKGRKAKESSGGDHNSIVKYSKYQTDTLVSWMIEHKNHPFPTCNEIASLSDLTGLSHSQIVNWTTNVRKRSLKATVEGGKKPHHFLDFLFLADAREKQNRKMTPHASISSLDKPTQQKRIKRKSITRNVDSKLSMDKETANIENSYCKYSSWSASMMVQQNAMLNSSMSNIQTFYPEPFERFHTMPQAPFNPIFITPVQPSKRTFIPPYVTPDRTMSSRVKDSHNITSALSVDTQNNTTYDFTRERACTPEIDLFDYNSHFTTDNTNIGSEYSFQLTEDELILTPTGSEEDNSFLNEPIDINIFNVVDESFTHGSDESSTNKPFHQNEIYQTIASGEYSPIDVDDSDNHVSISGEDIDILLQNSDDFDEFLLSNDINDY